MTIPRAPLLFFALGLSLAPGALAQADPYEVRILEALNAGTVTYPECVVVRVNDRGRAVGKSTYQSSYAGFHWQIESGMDVGVIPRDLNNVGDVLSQSGVHNIDTGQSLTIVSPVSSLPLVYANGINNDRVTVGHVKVASTAGTLHAATPFVWDPVGGTQVISSVPDAWTLIDVNDAGQAVGHIKLATSHSEMFVIDLDTGQWTNLSQLLPSNPLATYGYNDAVISISENGTVLGRAWDGTLKRAFVWHPAAGFTFLPGLNGGDPFRVLPRGINSRGEVVGSAVDANFDTQAFLWSAPLGMLDLNQLGTFPPNVRFQHANRINEHGWICGNGLTGHWSPPLGIVMRPATRQQDIGSGGPGVSRLEVSGRPLSNGNHADLLLEDAPPSTIGAYLFSWNLQPFPILGGTVAATPVFTTVGFATSGTGVDFVYGAIPGGTGPAQLFVQAVVLDPSTPFGLGFSNAVEVSLLP